jgi:hypothetical protein
MVAPSGDDFVFNYGAGMDGELIVDGKSMPLSEVVGAGLARPSATTAGAIEVPIPAKAKIRARAGKTTFLVSPVAKPRKQAAPLFNVERRSAAYVAGSLALHLGIIAVLQTIPPDDAGINVDLNNQEPVSIRTDSTQTDEVPPELVEREDSGAGGEPTAGGQMALPEGAAGTPDAANDKGQMQIANRNQPPQLSREQAIEDARNAGVLGSYQLLSGSIADLTSTSDLASGFDTTTVYGPLFGGTGEGRGTFGFGVNFGGPGGGCGYHDCGLVGAGRYATIGNGDAVGDNGWRSGVGGSGPFRRRDSQAPQASISMPSDVTDGLDKAIIKRYVKRTIAKISYCYESELLVKSSLSGTVTVQFLISSAGTVTQATGSGMDDRVASCVASVVKSIEFPRPTNGGSVQVNYPFNFRAAGH